MRASCLLFTVFAATSLLSADVISGDVCGPTSGDSNNLTPVVVISTTHCGSDRASASGSYSLYSNGISGELDGLAYGYSARAQVTFSDTFTTDGPVRAGTIRGIFQPSTFRYGGIVSTAIVSPTLPYPTFGPSAPPMSFVLGQPFTLTLVGIGITISDDGTPSTAQFWMPFDLSFFEADGVTPVALTEVTAAPEPSTWASLAGGLMALACFRRRVRR